MKSVIEIWQSRIYCEKGESDTKCSKEMMRGYFLNISTLVFPTGKLNWKFKHREIWLLKLWTTMLLANQITGFIDH